LDPQGNRTLLQDPDSVRTEYEYDELNRLETLTFGDGQAVTYEYFPDGLKKTVTNPNGTTSTYDYDAADRWRYSHRSFRRRLGLPAISTTPTPTASAKSNRTPAAPKRRTTPTTL
jgi:YD repeat-containing protein